MGLLARAAVRATGSEKAARAYLRTLGKLEATLSDAAFAGGRRVSADVGHGAKVHVNIGGGLGGLKPKEITFSSTGVARRELEGLAYEKDHAAYTLRRMGRGTPEMREMVDRAYGAVRADEARTARKVAVPMIRTVEKIVKDDMESRSPFALWSPWSGYKFYGAGNDAMARASRSGNARDAIYAKLLARNQHPDYFVQTDGHNVFLRRRFPLRHEVAAGGALGTLWPGDLDAAEPAAAPVGLLSRSRRDVPSDALSLGGRF